jgi:hypothetical protein
MKNYSNISDLPLSWNTILVGKCFVTSQTGAKQIGVHIV